MYNIFYEPPAFKDSVLREASLCLLSYFIKPLEASALLESRQNKREKQMKERKKGVEERCKSSRGRRRFAEEKHSLRGAGSSVFTLTVYFKKNNGNLCYINGMGFRVAYGFALINNRKTMRGRAARALTHFARCNIEENLVVDRKLYLRSPPTSNRFTRLVSQTERCSIPCILRQNVERE